MDIKAIQLPTALKRFSFHRITLGWYRHFKLIFTLLFLAVMVFGGYLWYESLYQYTWDDAQKKTYMEQTFTETNLKEKEFEKLLETLKNRAREYETPLQVSRNIFTGEPAVNQ